MANERATTLGELRASGYKVLPVREEMRNNLIAGVRDKRALFPGIVGFDETVIPQIENAILSGQDMILLGERGQAKSRIIRVPRRVPSLTHGSSPCFEVEATKNTPRPAGMNE